MDMKIHAKGGVGQIFNGFVQLASDAIVQASLQPLSRCMSQSKQHLRDESCQRLLLLRSPHFACRRMAQSLRSGALGEVHDAPSMGGRSIFSPVMALNQ